MNEQTASLHTRTHLFAAGFFVIFIFIGILGGLQVYGFPGILAGPLVVTLLTAFAQIYRQEFRKEKT